MSASTGERPVIVWFREDLRIGDNPALDAAVQTGSPLIPLFILDDAGEGPRKLGGASRWWLSKSLHGLGQDIRSRGGQLVLRRGRSEQVLDEILSATNAVAVFWNRRYGKVAIARDKALKDDLTNRGMEVRSFNARLLHEPWTVCKKDGTPFRVFTPFWKACLAMPGPDRPLPAPDRLPSAEIDVPSDDLGSWALQPTKPNWSLGFEKLWSPGETGASGLLAEFLTEKLAGYSEGRDRPADDLTSRLSPHLAFGEISPRQIHWAAERPDRRSSDSGRHKFLSEIGWREFAYHLLYHNPDLTHTNLQSRFDGFGWEKPGDTFDAWKSGHTGYPLVDAAMRQLWQTGWMHNRCRMVVGSFLVKHLLIDWRLGEEWFWDTLVDADPANNPVGWQWIAGCGADAAPYFRIFNPVLQSRKFDPEGRYIRHFCPELSGLDSKHIHEPWKAPAGDLEAAGIDLGQTYPRPVVDHKFARKRALEAFARTQDTD